MITNADRAELMRLIAEVKKELRKEFWSFMDNNYIDKVSMKTDSAISFVTLAENGSIDDVTAAEHTNIFSDWQIEISYKQGNIRKRNGELYKCLQVHTSQEGWEPENAPSLWKKIGDPTEEWPQWSQPVGAGDAYQTGDKVSHNGQHWVSEVANNVWEPGVYGWRNA